MRVPRACPRWLASLACLVCGAITVVLPSRSQAAQLPVLAWTERSDWINVRTDVTPAAAGDGIADDTAAIQAALNTAGNGITIYFPPGTYKVTGGLTLNGGTSHFGVNLIGHGRSTTLAWYGASGGNFITINGNPYGRYEGLILDGRGLAASGFYHNNTIGMFETSIRYKHVGLYNFTGNAIYALTGDASAVAETSYENCIFDHCATGMRMGGFNDYDHTFVGCDFIACGYGIYCNHGNFYARDCFFSGSTTVDIYAAPEHGCSVRRCKSAGSKKFITFSNTVSPCVVQDCYVTDWTGTGGAITHQSAPLVLSHSRFVNPPNTGAPVRCTTSKALLCNNTAPQSTAVATAPTLYTVPAGAYAPCVGSPAGSNITTFVNQTATVPPVVFDAKVNYGAAGNGAADDTVALQNTISAARTAGGGAIAYIPLGNYRITSTLTVTGSNYVIGGCGYSTRLVWGGAAGGTMMKVTAPSNVTLENILVGHTESGAMNNGVDIEQTSVSAASKMTYEGVYVFGKYQKQPENKGLYFNGLGSNSTVIMNLVEGNLRLSNSACATIIGNVTYEGAITVDDATSARTGFLGFMSRLSTLNTYGVVVRNNNNFVISDWYAEQCDNGLSLSGVAGNPSGRITVQGANSDFAGSTNAQFMTINDYQGQVFFGSNQLYCDPPVQSVVQTGTRALNIVLFSVLWYNTSLSFSATTATLNTVANQAGYSGTAPADNYTAQTLADMSAAMDDLQHLGRLDMDLNYPYVLPSTVPAAAAPSSGRCTGGYPVVITGANLSNGTTPDVTWVTLCGVTASVVSVSGSTQIVVTAGVGAPALGDVVVHSTSCGTTSRSNAFTYNPTLTVVVGPHGAVAPSGVVDVAYGGSTSLVVSADAYYHIGSLLTNGVNVGAAANQRAYTSVWVNVTATGALAAAFAENLTANTATPEWWLAQYGWTNNCGDAATNDADGDRMPTWAERLAGTDPTNPLSCLRMDALAPSGGATGMVIRWESVTGRLYAVDRGTNLLAMPPFLSLVTNIVGQTNCTTYSDTNAPGSGPWFYRIGVQ